MSDATCLVSPFFFQDSSAEALLSCLVCCGDRMPAEQIKSHEYFQVTEAAFTRLPSDTEESDDNTPAVIFA